MSQSILPYGHASQPDLFAIALKSRAFRGAVICWLISLGVGIAIFGLWVVTRAEFFQFAGLMWLGGGTMLAGASAACLLGFVINNWFATDRPARQVFLPAVLLVAMLGSNFVAAAGVLRAVTWVEQNWPHSHGLFNDEG